MTASGNGTLSYEWYSSTENSTSAGTKISGAMASKYSASTEAEGTIYYYCKVTNTAITAAGDEAMTVASDVAGVSIKALPSITKQPSGATVYAGETATLSVEAAGSGTLDYQWYSNAKNSSTGGKIISNATSSNYAIQTKSASTTYYYCVVKSKDSSISKGNTASVTSSTAAVTKTAVNASAPKMTSKMTSQKITIGKPVTLSIEAKGSGTLSYQWYLNTKSSTKGAAEISGATDKAYTVTPSTAGIYYYYCVVTNTDTAVSGSTTASAASKIVKIAAKA